MKLLLLTVFIGSLAGQTVIPDGEPESYRFDGQVNEWKSLPPTFQLRPSSAGGRTASVWVRQTAEGLLVAGDVQGSAPDFARTTADMLRKDHVEIWLAPERPPEFPVEGWSNNMMHDVGGSEEACLHVVAEWAPGHESDCRKWLAGIPPHRARVSRLFVRQYGMSPFVAFEAFAAPAWAQITHGSKDRQQTWAPLRPSGKPLFKAVPSGGGYGFEALLPWESLPPFSSLNLKTLRLMVDVFNAHTGAPKDQPFSSSSPARKYGDPSTLNLVSLATARQYRITDCQYPLEGRDDSGEKIPAIFRPARDLNIRQALQLVNENTFRGWSPIGDSPTVTSSTYSQKTFAPNVTACGPKFAWSDRQGIRRFNSDVDIDSMAAKAQPDGSWLVKTGPFTSDESLYLRIIPCSHCAYVDLHIFSIAPSGMPKPLFDFHEKTGDSGSGGDSESLDLDLHVSQDWSKITIYREQGDDKERHWTSETHCREGLEYRPCGENPKSPAPSPRVIDPLKE